MMTPIDAWLIACLRADRIVGLEDQGLASKEFHLLVNHLASLAAEHRDTAWKGFLTNRSDSAALIQSVADADPDGPRPKPTDLDDDGPGHDWEPIRLASLPKAEAFPLDTLPEPARELVDAVARSVGCPIDFPAVAALAVAAGVIGRSASLRLKSGYFASSGLWIAIIGPPSDAKSPAVGQVFGAVEPIDRTLQSDHKEAMTHWQAESPSSRSEPPRSRRIDLDDCTAEALIQVMASNPRGLVQFRDELAGLFHGMDQYRSGGKGSDRAKYLQIWSGKRVKIDRIKHGSDGPVCVPYPCLSIFGPLVPDKLASLADPQGNADGFVDRFLFTDPEQLPVPDWSDEGVENEILTPWYELVARLWSRGLVDEGNESHPHVLFLTGEARDTWSESHNAHVAAMNGPGFPAHLRGPYGKLREYAGRFALILALMDDAVQPNFDPEQVPDVTSRNVTDAWRLVNYFASHARRVHARIGGGRVRESDDVRDLLNWFARKEITRFSIRDVNRDHGKRFTEDDGGGPAALIDALDFLINRNMIRPHVNEEPKPGKKGRKKSSVFDVHPLLLNLPRFRQIRQKTSLADINVGNVGSADVLEGNHALDSSPR